MPITDATGSIATSWTEQSTVTLNAGTLATISSCVAEVESKLQRGTLSTTTAPTLAQVQTWLIRAKEELAEVKNFTFRRRFAYCALTAGTYIYSMPPDYAGGEIRIKDISNDRDIEVWPRHVYDMKFPDPSAESNNEPRACTIKNMELWFIPPPNAAITIQVEYLRSGADNTTTDFSWLPEIERFRCCDYAIAEGFESLQLYDRAQLYHAKWQQGLMKARRSDGKKVWNKHNYQTISWLQAYAARNYQSNND